MERKIADAWADVLGVERVGVHDDFFALGGHSFMVVQLLRRVRDLFGVEVPLAGVFLRTFTVAALAEQIDRAAIEDAAAADVQAVLGTVEDMTDEEVAAMLARDHTEEDR